MYEYYVWLCVLSPICLLLGDLRYLCALITLNYQIKRGFIDILCGVIIDNNYICHSSKVI
jgi:hypothetical protein